MKITSYNAIIGNGAFIVLPFVVPQTVYDMSRIGGQAKTTVAVSVTGKTYTDEELEYMAAVRAAARFHLPNAKLRDLAAKCRVPCEWYDTEEEKPF